MVDKIKKNIFNLLLDIWIVLDKRRKKQYILIIFLMGISAFFEFFSLGMVIPFLAVLANPGKLTNYPFTKLILDQLGIQNESIYIFTILFCFLIFSSAALRTLVLYVGCRFSFSLGADISSEIFKRTLYQPYQTHLNEKSSNLISAISSKTDKLIYEVINPLLVIISSIFLIFAILLTLILANPKIFLFIIGFLFILYSISGIYSKKHLLRNGNNIATLTSNLVESLQETLGAIRDIVLENNQKIYSENFRLLNKSLRFSQASNQFLVSFPRYLIESLGIIIIAVTAFYIVWDGGSLNGFIPFVGLVILGLQRLLPLLQQFYNGWANLSANHQMLFDLHIYLAKEGVESLKEVGTMLNFTKTITLKDVYFSYNQSTNIILNKINITIVKGAKVGVVGKTGSGKSTLIDVIMGLLEPTAGILLIDDKPIDGQNRVSWQKHIAHVPQQIFLSNSTILENIAFGVHPDEIDFAKVKDASRAAQLDDTVMLYRQKYQTIVGERGALLSGGQRQRIGIARALYKDADVLILDEATSALDRYTEQQVMDKIKEVNPNITIIIVTHRLETLSYCDYIVSVDGGNILHLGTYSEMLKLATENIL